MKFLNWILPWLALCCAAEERLVPGLTLRLERNGQAETRAVEQVALYEPAGEFTAVWNGFLNLELRSEFVFKAETSGGLKVTVNNIAVLEGSGPGKPIRLNKGTNLFAAEFKSAPRGDSWVRLSWAPRQGLFTPVTAFSHLLQPAEKEAGLIRKGRELFHGHRCSKCHGGVENEWDAPSFEGIGSRRNLAWMKDWIANPRKLRASAHMPKILGEADAAAAAAFLATLKSEPPPQAGPSGSEAGKSLFAKLNCEACHTLEEEPDKISLKNVGARFVPGALPRFLENPAAHYRWIRMPRFQLKANEYEELAAFLLANSTPPAAAPTGNVERGRTVVQISGCLNCHAHNLENKFSAPPLPAAAWDRGCLAFTPDAKAPWFGFSDEDRAALKAFGAARMPVVPMDLASLLNCRGCHGKLESIPPLEILGGKLKPEWTEAFLTGNFPYKPRPWIDEQMPAFPAYARELAQTLAAAHGFPPTSPPEGPIDDTAVETGRKLASVNGGFSCVTCHAVGDSPAQVTESLGLNFAHAAERLLKAYFVRWLSNPLAIDPNTKMPVYFDEEGRSPLADILEGDGEKQREAIWQFLRKEAPTPRQ